MVANILALIIICYKHDISQLSCFVGTNDAFVTIALAENKFQTTIKDKTIDPEWYEECDV